jgi:general secretion pathway protein D
VADERTNSVLLGGERTDRLRLRAIISHLDTPLDKGGNTDVVYLRYADATELVSVLMGVGKLEEQEAGAGKAVASSRGSFDIQADASTNALVITAPPDIMRTLRRVISQLDIRKAQVLVEAIIAEVSADVARELGVQWLFVDPSGSETPVGVINFTNTGTPITDIANAVTSLTGGSSTGSVPSVGTTNALLGFGDVSRNQFSYAAVLNALSSDTDSNILSTPTLVTLDNEEAEIIIGKSVPFVTGSFTSTGASSGATNPFQTIQREDVGLTLKIKPKINEGDAMRLDIEQEVSDIDPSVTGAADITTKKRAIKTNVMVDDGQIVVLGGLIEETIDEDIQKVPLLGDIPLLGNLFKSRSADVKRQNLMVFIHPVILRNSEDAAYHTNSKYNYLRELQRIEDADGVNLMPGKAHPVLPDISEYGVTPAAPLSPAPLPAPAADEPKDNTTSLFPTDE